MKVENINLKDAAVHNVGFICEQSVYKNARYEIIEGRLFLGTELSARARIKVSGRSIEQLIFIEDSEEIRTFLEKLKKLISEKESRRRKTRLIYLLTLAIILAIGIAPTIFTYLTGTLTTAKAVATATALTILSITLYLLYKKEKTYEEKYI